MGKAKDLLEAMKSVSKGKGDLTEDPATNDFLSELSSKYKTMFDPKDESGSFKVYDHSINFEISSNNPEVYIEFKSKYDKLK